jgi:hypothetical protein
MIMTGVDVNSGMGQTCPHDVDYSTMLVRVQYLEGREALTWFGWAIMSKIALRVRICTMRQSGAL